MRNILKKISSKDQRKYWLSVLVFLLFVSIAAVTPLSRYSEVLSAGYMWVQTDWSGGITANDALHPGNQSGWDEFESLTNRLTATNTLQFTLSEKWSSHSTNLVRSSSQYWSIIDTSQTGLDFAGDFTFEAWVKLDSLPSNETSPFGLFNKYNTDGNQRSYM
ncbi:MAG: hypothetical protein KAS07_02160, partial [Candidatus Pacebacteria bacterium]|nr:hypothetical protein [Candidatus Paceibacterota bacterium]